MNKRILFCGLGGGLDIINASVLYFIAKSKGIEVMLGSTRPSSQTYMYEHKSIDNCLSLVTKDTIFDFKGRYIEPRVSKILGEDVVFFSRRYNGKYSKTFLRNAVIAAKKELDLSHIFFIDGGGDSLILRSKDSGRSNYNVFKGGDAELLAAIRGISDVYMGVMSTGLDIKYHAFKGNKKIIKNINHHINDHSQKPSFYPPFHRIQTRPNFINLHASTLSPTIAAISEKQYPPEAIPLLP